MFRNLHVHDARYKTVDSCELDCSLINGLHSQWFMLDNALSRHTDQRTRCIGKGGITQHRRSHFPWNS